MDCLTFPQVMSFSPGEKDEKVVHFSGGAGCARQRPRGGAPYSSIVSSTGQWSEPKTSERIDAPVTRSAMSFETRK